MRTVLSQYLQQAPSLLSFIGNTLFPVCQVLALTDGTHASTKGGLPGVLNETWQVAYSV